MGRAQRVAHVVPEAQPFTTGLWGALTGAIAAAKAGKREAPPGHVPHVRFAAAARWFVALLEGAVLPLRRLVRASAADSQPAGPVGLAFDASPWGWGILRCEHCKPCAWAAGTWDDATLRRFRARTGDPAFQSLWEHIAELICLVTFAPSGEPFTVMGDNLGTLDNLDRLRGAGQTLHVAREVAWRRAAFDWQATPAHLPAELNVLCDSLSQLAVPNPKTVPETLRGVTRHEAPNLELLWKAWLPPKGPLVSGQAPHANAG